MYEQFHDDGSAFGSAVANCVLQQLRATFS